MSRLKLNRLRQGNTQLYQPNYEMLRALNEQRQEQQPPETPRAHTPPHDVSRISVVPQTAAA